MSDIHPGDWTYLALKEVRKDRKCKIVMPQGVITRVEAASFLNQCIGKSNALSDIEFYLVDKFYIELATIREI